jgi:hypothetical protein
VKTFRDLEAYNFLTATIASLMLLIKAIIECVAVPCKQMNVNSICGDVNRTNGQMHPLGFR